MSKEFDENDFIDEINNFDHFYYKSSQNFDHLSDLFSDLLGNFLFII